MYINSIDRIMGGVATIALEYDVKHSVILVCEYVLVCKSFALHVMGMSENSGVFSKRMALMLEVTKELRRILENVNLSKCEFIRLFSQDSFEKVKVNLDAVKTVTKIGPQTDLYQVLKKHSQ